MSERIEIVIPKKLLSMLNDIANRHNLTVNDLIIRAIVKIIEEERGK